MHNIHAGGITKKEYINVSHGRIMHTLFHEQEVYRMGTKWKKVYLKNVGNIAMMHYGSLIESKQCLCCSKNGDKKKPRMFFGTVM